MITPTEKFYLKLRKQVYKLCERNGITGFEASGVLIHLAFEVSATSCVRDGLLAPGAEWAGGFAEGRDFHSVEADRLKKELSCCRSAFE